jgi:hypothetical protein
MVTQMTGECLAPFTERRLADIEPFALLADGLHDNVHVRMWFIGMKGGLDHFLSVSKDSRHICRVN